MQKQAQPFLFVCVFKIMVLGMETRVCVLGKCSNKLPSDQFSQLLVYTVVYTLVYILLHPSIFSFFFETGSHHVAQASPDFVMAILHRSNCSDHRH